MSRADNGYLWYVIVVVACCWLTGCNEHQAPAVSEKAASANSQRPPHQDPSGRLIVKPLEYGDSATRVKLTATQAPKDFDTAKWRPLQASDAYIVEPNALHTAVILPVVDEQTTLSFALEVVQGAATYRAIAQIVVLPLANNHRFGGVISQSPEGGWLIPVDSDAEDGAFIVTVFTDNNAQDEHASFEVVAQENIISIPPNPIASCCDDHRIVKVYIAKNGQPTMAAWLLNSAADNSSNSAGSSVSATSSSPSPESSSSLISFSSSSVVSTVSSSHAQSSEVGSDVNSSNASSLSSHSEVFSSLSSLVSSSSSSSVSSSSSAPDARELAIAAICDISWQGLGALPSSHANYQTESPYINAEPFIDPVYVQHIEQSQQLETENTALVAAMEMLKTQPTGVWLDTEAGLCASVNDKPSLVDYLNLAEAQQQLLTLVLYNIPARDCVRQERPGDFGSTEQDLADYQRFIDRFSALAELYPNVPIAAVVEPTAFASTVSNGGVSRTGCYEARQLQLHERALDYALKRLAGNANIFTYLDYGDPAWPGSYNGDQALLELLASSQLADGSLAIEGLSLNVGSYVPMDEPFMLAQDNSGEPYTLPNGAHSVNAHREYLSGVLREQAAIELPMLVDTGRNGWGGELRPNEQAVGQESRVDRRVGREAWCNALDAGLGETYTAEKINVQNFWVHAPGVSDGSERPDCNANFNKVVHTPKLDAPPSGEWFHNYFVDLIQNANPPLISPAMPPQTLPLQVRVSPTQIPVQSAANVQMTLQLPENVSFASLSLRYAGEDISLADGWLGQNSVAFSLDIIPLTYFHDLLKITAQGSDGNRYYQEVAVFDSPEFDGKPIMDIALGGRGFFPDFYQLYQADLPEYTYTNNGFEGDDFLWLLASTHQLSGGGGNDYLEAIKVYGGKGDDTLATWNYANGGEGSDQFHVWGQTVVVEDTSNDFDVVYWLGRDFTDTNSENTYDFVADGDDLIAIENPGVGANKGVLTVKGFFADPPHINEIHYGDGQILTPETAREMLGIGE